MERSQDGTVKFAFRLDDGAAIESVLIPAEGRHTLCVSSQAGCAMGCRFCLTAGMGFQRNLTPAEIVNQVTAAQGHLIRSGVVRATTRQLIDNLVFMGMGEPLANYGNLITALTILMDDRGQGFSERRITVSTCGLVPRIGDLGRDIRRQPRRLAPRGRRRHPQQPDAGEPDLGVDEVLAACRAYPLSKRQVVFIEYVLIDGVNDSAADARQLAEKLQGHALPGQSAAVQRVAGAALPVLAAGAGSRLSGNPPRRRLPDAGQKQPRLGHRGGLRATGVRRAGRRRGVAPERRKNRLAPSMPAC